MMQGAYSKILDSSKTLLEVLKRESLTVQRKGHAMQQQTAR